MNDRVPQPGDLVMPADGTILVSSFGVGAAFAGYGQTPLVLLDVAGIVNKTHEPTVTHFVVAPETARHLRSRLDEALRHLDAGPTKGSPE